MSESVHESTAFSKIPAWKRIKKNRGLPSFALELTARCNNNCKHCYINLPAGDRAAKEAELSFEEIKGIVDEAVSLGALWCLITGGEPLLRKDFSDIYLYLKRKGLLISLFTNANLIDKEHAELFKKYPPRDMEISVYGATEDGYERVTRKPGSFATFMRGVNLLQENGVKARYKAVILRSNMHEMAEMAHFCEERTKDYFRFDFNLHLRFDGDPVRNEEIKSERLSPEEAVALERDYPKRLENIGKNRQSSAASTGEPVSEAYLFRCGVGNTKVYIGYNGFLRPCSSLWHPDFFYDLRNGSLADAWNNLIPKVRTIRTDNKEFLQRCRICPLVDVCLWCPAHAYLETGKMDVPVECFCEMAHARVAASQQD